MDALELLKSFEKEVEGSVKLLPPSGTVPIELIPDYPEYSASKRSMNLNVPIFFLQGECLSQLNRSFVRFELEEELCNKLYYCFISFLKAVVNIRESKVSKDTELFEFIASGKFKQHSLKSISFGSGKRITDRTLLYIIQTALRGADISHLLKDGEHEAKEDKEIARQFNLTHPLLGFQNLQGLIMQRYFCLVLEFLLKSSMMTNQYALRLAESFISSAGIRLFRADDDDKTLYDRAFLRLKKDPNLYDKWTE